MEIDLDKWPDRLHATDDWVNSGKLYFLELQAHYQRTRSDYMAFKGKWICIYDHIQHCVADTRKRLSTKPSTWCLKGTKMAVCPLCFAGAFAPSTRKP